MKISGWAAVAVILTVLCACGDLKARRGTEVYYDLKKEGLVITQTFKDVRAEKDSALNDLKELWDNRAQLIFPFMIPQMDALVRLSDTQYRPCRDLSYGLSEETDSVPFSLSCIEVIPGGWTLDSEKTLCYRHQNFIPNQTVRETLEFLTPAFQSFVEKASMDIQKDTCFMTWDAWFEALERERKMPDGCPVSKETFRLWECNSILAKLEFGTYNESFGDGEKVSAFPGILFTLPVAQADVKPLTRAVPRLNELQLWTFNPFRIARISRINGIMTMTLSVSFEQPAGSRAEVEPSENPGRTARTLKFLRECGIPVEEDSSVKTESF